MQVDQEAPERTHNVIFDVRGNMAFAFGVGAGTAPYEAMGRAVITAALAFIMAMAFDFASSAARITWRAHRDARGRS